MTKHEIYIRIDYEGAYRIENVSNALKIAFNKDEPYDKLSRRFKKFSHKPLYPEHEKYQASDYNLYIVHKDYKIFNYIIHFLNPSKKIVSVDAYFRLQDKNNYQPLIFGFNDVDGNTLYYTYNHLFNITYKWFFPVKHTGSLSLDGSFEEEDLETRLLEEYGLHESTRYNKFLVRLEKRTNETELKYPKTGKNKERITVKKPELLRNTDFVKYEHAIDKSNNVEAFYVGFYNNSLYMFDNYGLGKLQYVDAYYKKNDQLVLIVFKFQRGSKLYRCSEFLNDVNKTDPVRNISRLPTFERQDITSILIDESNKFKHEIEFRKGSKENTYISEKNVCLKGTKFFSVLMKPNIKEENKGSSIGPWIVYGDSLFIRNPHIKIDATSFKGIVNSTFTSIDLYYNEKNEPLLVGFVGTLGTKFFKRSNSEGNKWVEEYRPRYVSDGTLSLQLQKISNPLFTTVGLILEKKNEYKNSLMISGRINESRISVVKHSDGPANFKAEGYVCYEHKLFDYYERSNTKGTVPKLVLEPAIGTIQIRLIGPDDNMAWPLTYTNPDHSTSTKNESVFVYFAKSNSVSSTRDNDNSDTLPLLFCYNDKFYTPKNKNQYFGHWINAGITGSTNEGGVLTPQKRLKEALDRNFNIANKIDITKTKSYGLKCCSEHPYYYKPNGFTTKRVHVTCYMNTFYTMYGHTAVFKNNIGNIIHGNPSYTFNSHTSAVRDKKIDQVVVIYTGNDNKTNEPPLLVLLNQTNHSQELGGSEDLKKSTTYGYYYQDTAKSGRPISYKFHYVKEGSNIMAKLMGYQVEGEGLPALPDPKAIQPIQTTLNSIGSTKMLPTVAQNLLELDTSECKGSTLATENESSGMCEEFLGLDIREEEDDDEEEEEEEEDDADLFEGEEGEEELQEEYIERIIQDPTEIVPEISHLPSGPSGEESKTPQGGSSEVLKAPDSSIPVPARPPVPSRSELGSTPTMQQPLSHPTTSSMETSSRTPTTSGFRTHVQPPSRTSGHPPGGVSHTSTQSRDTSLEVTKAQDRHLPERESQGRLSTADGGQLAHDKSKLPKVKATKTETPNYVVVILLNNRNQYEISDFLQYLDKFNRENVLNTRDYVTVNPKEDSIWDLFKGGLYSVYEHDFEKSLRKIQYNRDQVEFKFIIDVNSRGVALDLYNSEQLDQLLKLNYRSIKKSIHVYFARDRTKPLLFCFNGNLYRPISHDDYDQIWFKLRSIRCPCSSNHVSTVQQLLLELNKVEELLNQYEMLQKPTVHHHQSPQHQGVAHTTEAQSSGATPGTIAGASVGSLVGTAAVTGGVTLATHPEWLIPVIKALT